MPDCTTHFGFEPRSSAAPAFADGRRPQPGGWNRIHLVVEDLTGEVERLRAVGNPIELFQPAGA